MPHSPAPVRVLGTSTTLRCEKGRTDRGTCRRTSPALRRPGNRARCLAGPPARLCACRAAERARSGGRDRVLTAEVRAENRTMLALLPGLGPGGDRTGRPGDRRPHGTWRTVPPSPPAPGPQILDQAVERLPLPLAVHQRRGRLGSRVQAHRRPHGNRTARRPPPQPRQPTRGPSPRWRVKSAWADQRRAGAPPPSPANLTRTSGRSHSCAISAWTNADPAAPGGRARGVRRALLELPCIQRGFVSHGSPRSSRPFTDAGRLALAGFLAVTPAAASRRRRRVQTLQPAP